MDETNYVEETLKLLAGMQKLRQTCADVIVNDKGVEIVGLTIWDPPSLDLKMPTQSEFEGHGIPPDDPWNR